jgi:hypothetical protein
MAVVFGGIILGGVLGISLGLWILLWWRGPRGDVLKIRDKLPEWMVPEWKEPEETPPADGDGADPNALDRRQAEVRLARRLRARAGEGRPARITSTFADDATIFRV